MFLFLDGVALVFLWDNIATILWYRFANINTCQPSDNLTSKVFLGIMSLDIHLEDVFVERQST